MSVDKMARVTPGDLKEFRGEWIETLARIPGASLKGEKFPKNVLSTMMHNPETFGPFLNYWVTSKLEMNLVVREQELIILRMGVLYRCDYVWKHHYPLAIEFGLSELEIEGVRIGAYAALPAREQQLLLLTDELVSERTISEDAWAAGGRNFSPAEIVDLISLVSQYVFFALLNNAAQVEIEAPVRGISGLNEPLNVR
jgi:4-carboxymuconolactone decarboxylase